MNQSFEVIVIGGGHAGCEAASASARLGARTLLLTKDKNKIGEMSCNPSIGGIAKGIIVREIDALGGVMARAIDESGTHFKVLNSSKGAAVHGPRAQADRQLYRQAMQKLLNDQENLTIYEASVAEILTEDGQIRAIKTEEGQLISCLALILTTGTFLNGLIHLGSKKIPAGRSGESPSIKLSESLRSFGFAMGRLKTGTPPRLDGRSINYDDLEIQEADNPPLAFSFLNHEISVKQLGCYITYTNENTHQIIRDNLHQSAIYSKQISSIGPRYCPSIEDKIVRFADKKRHQIFLEKEGLDDDTIYPNGLSTSLPEEVQISYIHSIKGLEEAKITAFGYAIEYDFVDPRELSLSLETKKISGLFLAGQINGTTGYEEAAGQGIIAGFNAALKIQNRERFILERSDAYIGVLIDDLVRLGAKEPYRIFTSRAEYRLRLRADNADLRLTEKAMEIGAICQKRINCFTGKKQEIESLKSLLLASSFTPNQVAKFGIHLNFDGKRRSGFDLLKYTSYENLTLLLPEIKNFSEEVKNQLLIQAKYSDYIILQDVDIAMLKKDESLKIPIDFDYDSMPSLSNEVKEKLNLIRPENLAQASRISGVTPAALTAILIRMKQRFSSS